MDYQFHAPPTVAQFTNGQFIVGVMPPVPYSPEKLAELQEAYAQRIQAHKQVEESMKSKTVEVVSNSDPNKKYTLNVYSDGKVECECRGFQFRRSCSHVDKYKKENGL
jgi:hypothetical protein